MNGATLKFKRLLCILVPLLKAMAAGGLVFTCAIVPALAAQPEAASPPLPPVMTLADVIRLALQANRNIISSDLGVQSQSYSVTAAQSEFDWKYFPAATATADDINRRVGMGVTVEKKFTPGPSLSIGPRLVRNFGDHNLDTFSEELGARLTVPLLRGLGSEVNLSEVRSAEYALRSTERSTQIAKVNTVLDAVADTYEIVQQRELMALYSGQVQRFREHAVIAETRKNIGLAGPIDVYRAEIRLKDAQSSLARAQESLRNAGDRLKIILGAPLEQIFTVVAPLEIKPIDISLDQAVDTALRNRVELKQARDDVDEAKRLSHVAQDNLNPRLDLVANYVRSQFDERFLGVIESEQDFWSVSLSSTTDWSRKAEKAAYQQSLLTVSRARLSSENRTELVKREVRQDYEALLNAREQIKIREAQIGQADGKLALAKIKFKHGMADNFDVIESETELQQARTNLLAAKIDYIVGLYRLRAAIGTLIQL